MSQPSAEKRILIFLYRITAVVIVGDILSLHDNEKIIYTKKVCFFFHSGQLKKWQNAIVDTNKKTSNWNVRRMMINTSKNKHFNTLIFKWNPLSSPIPWKVLGNWNVKFVVRILFLFFLLVFCWCLKWNSWFWRILKFFNTNYSYSNNYQVLSN